MLFYHLVKPNTFVIPNHKVKDPLEPFLFKALPFEDLENFYGKKIIDIIYDIFIF